MSAVSCIWSGILGRMPIWLLESVGDPVLGSLYEGSYYFGSI